MILVSFLDLRTSKIIRCKMSNFSDITVDDLLDEVESIFSNVSVERVYFNNQEASIFKILIHRKIEKEAWNQIRWGTFNKKVVNFEIVTKDCNAKFSSADVLYDGTKYNISTWNDLKKIIENYSVESLLAYLNPYGEYLYLDCEDTFNVFRDKYLINAEHLGEIKLIKCSIGDKYLKYNLNIE